MYELEIKNKEGVMVYASSGELKQGYNFISYDLNVDQNGLKDLKKKDKKKALLTAKNGITYLPKGTFTATIRVGKKSDTQELILE
jgi:hypothetical protein